MNTIRIIQLDDTQSKRHGGWRQYRHFECTINGFTVEVFNDDSAATNYASGSYLDDLIQLWAERYQIAIGAEVIRQEKPGRVKLL